MKRPPWPEVSGDIHKALWRRYPELALKVWRIHRHFEPDSNTFGVYVEFGGGKKSIHIPVSDRMQARDADDCLPDVVVARIALESG